MKTTSKSIVAALIAALSLGFAPTTSAQGGHAGHHGHHAQHHSGSGYNYRPSYNRGYSTAPIYHDDYAPGSFVIAGHHHHHHHHH